MTSPESSSSKIWGFISDIRFETVVFLQSLCLCSAPRDKVDRQDTDVASLHLQCCERKISCSVSILQRASLRWQGSCGWVRQPIRMLQTCYLCDTHLCALTCVQWVWRTCCVMWRSYNEAWSSPGESSAFSTTARSKTSSAETNRDSTSCRRTHASPRWHNKHTHTHVSSCQCSRDSRVFFL